MTRRSLFRRILGAAVAAFLPAKALANDAIPLPGDPWPGPERIVCGNTVYTFSDANTVTIECFYLGNDDVWTRHKIACEHMGIDPRSELGMHFQSRLLERYGDRMKPNSVWT